ncbi:MAG TPA: S-layer homology domain-containing protein [Candidatus Limnocylindria bacterium]|nr:S-layer homology domain-containing protein [Candidatus Limnocylindria bacterium]
MPELIPVSHRRSPRSALALAAPLVLSLFMLPVFAAPVAATGGSTLVTLANGYRANAGAPSVALNAAVDQIATERGQQLAAAGALSHDLTYVANRLAQMGVCWGSMGEIIAWNTSGDYAAFLRQWYNSDGHRAIMLDPKYTDAGGSAMRSANGRYYAVMIFIRGCGGSTPAAPAAPSGTFSDTAGSPFLNDIEWLVDAGITNGCGGGRFCPSEWVSRGQMASFIARADTLPSAAHDYFPDDAGIIFEPDINRVAQASITNGCGGGLYCPASGVTREQMAAFLVRALNLPATSADYFVDDEASPLEDAINRLAAAGVTNGCGNSGYCPTATVTREEMAAFLHRAFD